MKNALSLLALLFLSLNLKAQGTIVSITMDPAAPDANDTIRLFANLQFPNSGCDLDFQSQGWSGSTLVATSHHCMGMLTAICNTVDTFVLVPPHTPGNYTMDLTLTSGAAPAPCTPGFAPDDNLPFFFEILPVILPPAPGKVVVIESASGTWCTWCPRGTANMLYMENTYGDTVEPISVHNNDPMTNLFYDSDLGSYVTVFPSGWIDRIEIIDPSEYEAAYLDRVSVPPTTLISNTFNYNNATRELTVNITTNFVADTSGDWRIACVITEDSVHGIGSGYDYQNGYSGGGLGPMGGFENLPNPVPASQMYYPFVAREIQPGFYGQPNSFPASIVSGTPYYSTFTFTLDTSWIPANINIISMVIGPDSIIDNAGTLDLYQFLDLRDLKTDLHINLYPNPATDYCMVDFFLHNTEEIRLELIDLNGKIIAARDYGRMGGRVELPVITSNLPAGFYAVRITAGNENHVLKLLVE